MNHEKLLAKGKKLIQSILDELNNISEEYIRSYAKHRRQEDFDEMCIALALQDRQKELPDDILRRIGKFKINAKSTNYIDREMFLPQVFKLMGNMFVYRCEYHFGDWMLEYSACSPLFEPIPEDMEAPWYEVIFSEEGFEIKKKDDNSL